MAAIAAAVALAVALGAMLATGVFASPHEKFLRYHQQLVSGPVLAGLESWAKQAGDMRDLSTDLTFTASTNDESTQNVLEGSAIGLQVDIRGSSILLGADVTLRGQPLVSGVASWEQGVLGFYVPKLDERYFTLDVAEKADQAWLEELELPQVSTEALESAIKAYSGAVLSVVNKGNVTRTRADFLLEKAPGGLTRGEIYTFRPTAADVEAMLLELAQVMESNTDLQRFLEDYLDASWSVLKLISQDGVPDLLTELDEVLLNGAAYLREHAAEMGKTVEDSGFTWTLAVTGKQVRQIYITARNTDGKDCLLALERDEDTHYIALWGAQGQEELFVLQAGYEKTPSGAYSGSVSVGKGLEFTFTDADPKTKSALGYPYGLYEVEGEALDGSTVALDVHKADNGGTDHVMTMTWLWMEEGLSLELVCNSTDQESTIQRPTAPVEDLTGYSDTDFETLGEKLYASYFQVLMEAYGILLGSYSY